VIRIRFHGRGGHRIKTASRILGTAAFLSSYQVQDSPVYGAERRGVAISAFTRIDRDPILERGVIERPDLIVFGDETLLGDPAAETVIGRPLRSHGPRPIGDARETDRLVKFLTSWCGANNLKLKVARDGQPEFTAKAALPCKLACVGFFFRPESSDGQAPGAIPSRMAPYPR
jgi:hypothetical protein